MTSSIEAILKNLESIKQRDISSNNADVAYRAQRLPHNESQGWIGSSSTGTVAFLLEVDQTQRRAESLELAAISVHHNCQVTIEDKDGLVETRVSIIECKLQCESTAKLFIRTVGGVLENEVAAITPDALNQIVVQLHELFRPLNPPSYEAVLGLWGELFTLVSSPNPKMFAECWREKSTSKSDFYSDRERLEIKTTTKEVRQHEISFRQVGLPAGVAGAFVSIMTEHVSSGTTIGRLWDQALSRASGYHFKIDEICVKTLGGEWQSARNIGFDISAARSNFQVFSFSDVPQIALLPSGVLTARYLSDFDFGQPWLDSPPIKDGLIAGALSIRSTD